LAGAGASADGAASLSSTLDEMLQAFRKEEETRLQQVLLQQKAVHAAIDEAEVKAVKVRQILDFLNCTTSCPCF